MAARIDRDANIQQAHPHDFSSRQTDRSQGPLSQLEYRVERQSALGKDDVTGGLEKDKNKIKNSNAGNSATCLEVAIKAAVFNEISALLPAGKSRSKRKRW